MADRKVTQLTGLSSSSIDMSADMIYIADNSANESKKTTGAHLLAGTNNLAEITTSSSDDIIYVYDTSTATSRKISVANLINTGVAETCVQVFDYSAITTSNDWSANGNGANKQFTHGLNSTDLSFEIYGSDNSFGSGNIVVANGIVYPNRYRSKERYGAQIHSVTSTTFEVQLAKSGYYKLDRSGNSATPVNWSWIKIIVRK